MSATIAINGETLSAQFSAPWDLEGHKLFLRAKSLPEAKYEFDRPTDSYRITSPARFAHLLGIQYTPPARVELDLSTYLFDYQSFIVRLALEAKRFAIWADCGLGKTAMFLEWARHVSARTGGGRVLILSPNNILPQTMAESLKWYGAEMPLKRIDQRDELEAWCKGELNPEEKFAIANHHKFIPGPIEGLRWCDGVALDESSCLKSGGGVIKWNLIKSARGIEYKLSCTATPAPNDTMEYASQANFLEKLRNEGEILWTYFMRDPKTKEWKVRPHARKAFYAFMSSWSIYLRKPSAYGFADTFTQPEPVLNEIKIQMTDEQALAHREYLRECDGDLLGKENLGVRERSKLSQIAKGFVYIGQGSTRTVQRIPSLKPAAVAQLVKKALFEGRQILVWTVFDEESEIIMEALAKVKCKTKCDSLHGEDDEEERDAKLEQFRLGDIRCLVSKAQLLGFGMNFQFCSCMIFSGFNDSWEAFYQAVRRAHRYGSTQPLDVYVPFIPELEEHMWNNLLRKKGQWEDDIAEQERNYVTAMKQITLPNGQVVSSQIPKN